jgi:hypothetical protein
MRNQQRVVTPRTTSVGYEPPAIEERTKIGVPLAQLGSVVSAAFRPSVADRA